MDKLNEIKELVKRADNFMHEANYQFAVSCYDSIVLLLRQALVQATSDDSIKAVQHKIHKFVELKAVANAKLAEKEPSKVRVSKFGFPTQINPDTSPHFTLKKNAEIVGKTSRVALKQDTSKEYRKPQVKPRAKVEIPPAIEELIVRNIDVSFKDIVGLKEVKDIMEEAVIRPRQRPDLYTGIRAPPKGLLLYGPPGNGKTFLCKALAKESECTFFALSASSILNKLVGESEKMVKRIFLAAQQLAPSIIFIDEIDSMLTARSQNQHQASRRLKTQFLVLMDGINSPKSGDVMVIGATNLPKQLDAAAKRRFSKMIYVGNPSAEARREMVIRNMKGIPYQLSQSEITKMGDKLECYSASEIRNIIAETCMIPLRELETTEFKSIKKTDLRKINLKDFLKVLATRKPILSKEELLKYKMV